MIIVMKPQAVREEIGAVVKYIEDHGLSVHLSQGEEVTIIGIIGDKSKISSENLTVYKGVDRIVPVTESYKLSNRKFHPEPTTVSVGNTSIGPGILTIMAGPCAVETEEQLMEIAIQVKKSGATILRGGAYKPRTSPYSFQGLEEEGLRFMQNAKKETLNAAEYIIAEGNPHVVLCERGIRTYETATRNTLDLSAVPVMREKTHLPVIVDPSHSTGSYKYVPAMAKAAVACDADGLMIEVHNDPAHALSDGPNTLSWDILKNHALRRSSVSDF